MVGTSTSVVEEIEKATIREQGNESTVPIRVTIPPPSTPNQAFQRKRHGENEREANMRKREGGLPTVGEAPSTLPTFDDEGPQKCVPENAIAELKKGRRVAVQVTLDGKTYLDNSYRHLVLATRNEAQVKVEMERVPGGNVLVSKKKVYELNPNPGDFHENTHADGTKSTIYMGECDLVVSLYETLDQTRYEPKTHLLVSSENVLDFLYGSIDFVFPMILWKTNGGNGTWTEALRKGPNGDEGLRTQVSISSDTHCLGLVFGPTFLGIMMPAHAQTAGKGAHWVGPDGSLTRLNLTNDKGALLDGDMLWAPFTKKGTMRQDRSRFIDKQSVLNGDFSNDNFDFTGKKTIQKKKEEQALQHAARDQVEDHSVEDVTQALSGVSIFDSGGGTHSGSAVNKDGVSAGEQPAHKVDETVIANAVDILVRILKAEDAIDAAVANNDFETADKLKEELKQINIELLELDMTEEELDHIESVVNEQPAAEGLKQGTDCQPTDETVILDMNIVDILARILKAEDAIDAAVANNDFETADKLKEELKQINIELLELDMTEEELDLIESVVNEQPAAEARIEARD